jgi:2-methylcitrate dehydratase PrpD
MDNQTITSDLADFLSARKFEDLNAAVLEVTKHCLLDYLGVAIAAREEPLVLILLEQQQEEGGHPQATVIGSQRKATLQQACLINGAMGHTHDYDDVHPAMSGHPTVPIAPAVLALAEHEGRSGKELLLALATGIDTECILGQYVGPSHYARGFHATATLGTLGAAAACAKLSDLDPGEIINALGIAATQAAGLKSMFGTMCKPFHAGNAAANGLFAAQIARKGFNSQQSSIEIAQGFAATHSDSPSDSRFVSALGTGSFVPTVLFKYHAACYLTHSALEATKHLKAIHELNIEDIEQVVITVSQGHFSVCNIQKPVNGLEAKFSLRFACAMVLAGIDTAGIEAFNDDLTNREDMIRWRDRIRVEAFPDPRAESRVEIHLCNGEILQQDWDVAIPATDLSLQLQKLEAKFMNLVRPVFGQSKAAEIASTIRDIEELEDVSGLLQLIA